MDSEDATVLTRRQALASLQYRSLCLFTGKNKFRIFIVHMMHNSVAETITIIVILANCVFLALDDPTTSVQERYQEIADICFVVLFTFECVCKVIGRGFVFHPFAYLRDNWNRLDFLIVILSYLQFVGQVDQLKAIKTLRVLRPLRSINGIPGLKAIVTVLIRSFAQLANVLGLAVFAFLIFGILGVQLWGGEMKFRCMMQNATTHTWSLYSPDNPLFCNDPGSPAMGVDCPGNTSCLPYQNPNRGYTSFDHMGWAFLTIFQTMTLEGWSSIMYMLDDLWGRINVLYFVLLIVFGTFFVLNLVLAVLSDNFSKLGTSGRGDLLTIRDEENGVVLLSLSYERGPIPQAIQDGSGVVVVETVTRWYSMVQRAFHWILLFPNKEGVTPYYSHFMLLCIIANTVFLASEHHNQPQELTDVLDIGNFVITIIFIVELAFKMIALGPKSYFHDRFNVVDFVVVLLSVVEFFTNSGTSVFRSMRLIRVFKMLRQFPGLRQIIRVILKSIGGTGYLNVIFLLYLFIAALMGMSLFGGTFSTVSQGSKPRAHFDGMLWAFLTVFQVVTQDNWPDIMWNGMDAVDPAMSIYFVILIVGGVMVILNLFLAILIEGFDSHQGASDASEDDGDDDEDDEEVVHINYDVTESRKDMLQHAKPPPNTGPISRKRIWFTVMKGQRLVFVEPKVKEGQFQFFSKGGTQRTDNFGDAILSYREDDNQANAEPSTFVDLDKQASVKLGGAFFLSVVRARNFHLFSTTYTNGGTSLFLFGPENPFRIFCTIVVQHKAFDGFIMLLILASSIMLALESPSDDPDSEKVYILSLMSEIFTFLFTAEMFLKVVAFGLYFENGSYLRDEFNVLDCVVVFISLITTFLDGSTNLKSLRALRTFRAIRPLRFINRNRGLKMVVLTLIRALPGIAHVAVISVLIYLVFAILGVQFFSGTLYSCTDATVLYRVNCTGVDPTTNSSRSWIADPQNFDNVLNSMLTLFEISTLEGWAAIMYRTMDGVSYDQAPVRDNKPLVSLFFLVVVIVCAFFVLNLFVGVVIYNFNKVKMGMDGLLFLTEEQRLWTETQRIMLRFRPAKKPLPFNNRFSHATHRVAYSLRFEIFIAVAIILNVTCLAMEYDGMSASYTKFLQYSNYVFTAIFLFESLLKLSAIGLHYFKDGWNQFDFFLVSLSVMGIILDELSQFSIPMNTGVLRTFRVFRIARMMRLVKASKDIRVLLETLWYSLPSLGNVGGFLLLLFFIYACIGVSLFGKVKRGNYLTKNANFESFDRAILLLLRMSTGEDWNGVMHDCMVSPPLCDDRNDECGNGFAPVYFVSFVLLASMIMINLFIAIILDNFSSTMKLEDSQLKMKDLTRFVDAWSDFDPHATMLMPTHRVPALLARLGTPLGIKSDYTRLDILRKTVEYQIPEHGGQVHFVEVLVPLARRVMDVHLDFFAMRAEEESWQLEFPEIKYLPVLRYRQKRITIDMYFSAAFVAAAFKRWKAQQLLQKLKQEKILREMDVHVSTSALWSQPEEECAAPPPPIPGTVFTEGEEPHTPAKLLVDVGIDKETPVTPPPPSPPPLLPTPRIIRIQYPPGSVMDPAKICIPISKISTQDGMKQYWDSASQYTDMEIVGFLKQRAIAIKPQHIMQQEAIFKKLREHKQMKHEKGPRGPWWSHRPPPGQIESHAGKKRTPVAQIVEEDSQES